ncbi:hypothetical protein PRIC2_013880 [Phytophthora ramorum]
MATPQLLDAAIRSDGAVREAPYTLLCMVVAVERASAITWPPRSDGTDVMAIYSAERDVDPFERVLQAADECSLQRNKFKLKKRELKVQQEDEEGNLVPRMSSVHVQYDLERLLHSTSRLETRRRLEEQLEDLRLAQIRELTGVLLPKHLQITAVEEDPLEFRRDTRGIAQVWGRNVLGEHYAPTNDPLRFLHSHSVPELFQRMKRIVREDLSTRNKRRIASLNAKERARQQELQRQGILSPEQQLEAKFDRLLNASAAAS